MKYRSFSVSVALLVVCLLSSDNADAAALSDPQAAVSGDCASGLVLEKELNGFANYGVADARADVVYSGEDGTWTFKDPCVNTETAYLRIAAVLDDHYNIPVANYELEVVVNGNTVAFDHADTLGIRHGTPYGEAFNNWQYLWIEVKPAAHYQVSVHNRSGLSQDDWIAIDKISMHLSE